jgi:hypothetical protein
MPPLRSLLNAIFCREDDPSRIDVASMVTIAFYAMLFGLLAFLLFVMPVVWGRLPSR